jgi:hypothetical protein
VLGRRGEKRRGEERRCKAGQARTDGPRDQRASSGGIRIRAVVPGSRTSKDPMRLYGDGGGLAKGEVEKEREG